MKRKTRVTARREVAPARVRIEKSISPLTRIIVSKLSSVGEIFIDERTCFIIQGIY